MTALWSASCLRNATGGRLDQPFEARGVSIDTRTTQSGELFIALATDTGDGHDHVAAALAAGAAGVMVHKPQQKGTPALLVDDTLAGLTRLGAYGRERFTGRLVAITGSVGKTTTKEMVRLVLAAFGDVHAAAASHNNHWGVPLTLARLPPRAAFCVAEIGMNHAGEIAPLTRLARPHVTVITTIAAAHIGYLGGLDAIAGEKASIQRGLAPGGVSVLPLDSPWFARLREQAGDHAIVTFGVAKTADVRLAEIDADSNGSSLLIDVRGRDVRFRLPAPGRHMAMNALAALASAEALDLDPARSAAALAAFEPLRGRGARRRLMLASGPVLLLDESYNANGASMRAALDVLRLQPAARRIAVLGDMLELGDAGPVEHASLAPDVARSADLVFTCGPLSRHLFEALPDAIRGVHAPDAETLAPLAAARAASGDAILVKGSLGSRMRTVVAALDDMVRPEGA